MMKKTLMIISCVVVTAVVMSTTCSFSEARARTNDICLPQSEKAKIVSETKGMDSDDIIDYCVARTCKLLRFSSSNEPIRYHEVSGANCVNYAKLCAAMCDVALDANGYNCRATPVVGYVKTMGVNVNTVLSGLLFWSDRWSSFTKDHDFVKIQFPDKTVYVDASMKDLFGTSQKQTIENE